MDHTTLVSFDKLADVLFYSSINPHGTVHRAIGGMYGCDQLEPLIDIGLTDADGLIDICQYWFVMVKQLYRWGYIIPAPSCALLSESNYSAADLNCSFTCDPTANYTTFVSDVQYLLVSVGDYSETSKDIMNQVAEFICDPSQGASKVFPGDHLESASSADPSFWPIHPTLERLLQAKHMAHGFTSVDWPTDVEDICQVCIT